MKYLEIKYEFKLYSLYLILELWNILKSYRAYVFEYAFK